MKLLMVLLLSSWSFATTCEETSTCVPQGKPAVFEDPQIHAYPVLRYQLSAEAVTVSSCSWCGKTPQ